MPKTVKPPKDARKIAGEGGKYEDTLRHMFEGIQSQDDLSELLGGGVAGSVIPLASGDITSAGESFTIYSSMDATYSLYYIYIRGMLVSAASKELGIQFGSDTGATDYAYVLWEWAAGTFADDHDPQHNMIRIMDTSPGAGSSSANSEEMTATMYVHAPADSTLQTTVEGTFFYNDTSTPAAHRFQFFGARNADQADTTINLIIDTGGSTTFSAGTYTIYGIKQ